MKIPKVFISYSHDNQEHKKWVLDMAIRLRNSGVDATLDQWELKPGDDLPHFMEQNLSKSDYVIMVCTERYVRKANDGIGGVGYEKMIITSELMSNIDVNKIIPIIKQEGTKGVPVFLKTKLYIDFSRKDEYEYAFDELIRAIHNAPVFEKPEIGGNPFSQVKDTPAHQTGDPIRELMRVVVTSYENGVNATDVQDIKRALGISRIMTDSIIYSAVNEELLYHNRAYEYVQLTDKGKFYALQNKLIV